MREEDNVACCCYCCGREWRWRGGEKQVEIRNETDGNDKKLIGQYRHFSQ